jgi:hypothetical protein
MACRQWRAIGTCRLAETDAAVRIIATASDLHSDRRFYVVQGDGPCFGVWPEETLDAQWSQPLPRKPQFFLGN